MSHSWWVVTRSRGEPSQEYPCPSLSAAVRFRQTIEELGECAAIDYRDEDGWSHSDELKSKQPTL